MNESCQTVVVLGASPKPDRYSNKAIRLLLEYGHTVIPVHPAITEIEGLEAKSSLGTISESVDTLTMYVSPSISNSMAEQIIGLNPKRVIFNPGTENPILSRALESAGIETEEACTLVLLNTGQF
ncbi:MAG: CoA-binding protein [Pontiella sp.]